MLNMKCHHNPKDKCACICHESGKLLIHAHSCCSQCLECGFRTRCSCKWCANYKEDKL